MKRSYFYETCLPIAPLHTTIWQEENTPLRGIIHIVHGICEYSDLYENFAQFLAKQGFLVLSCDLLGHGKSILEPQDLGFFAPKNGWELLVSSVYELGESVKQKHPTLPYFFFGHSMGSFVVRHILTKEPKSATAAILSGTGQPESPLLHIAKKLVDTTITLHGENSRSEKVYHFCLDAFNHHIKPRRNNCDWLTRDSAVTDARMEDRLSTFVPTTALVRDILDGLFYLGKDENLENMNRDMPLLFVSGTQDPVGEYGFGLLRLIRHLEKLGFTSLHCQLYPGGRHEMLKELNHQEVYDHILLWLEERLSQSHDL